MAYSIQTNAKVRRDVPMNEMIEGDIGLVCLQTFGERSHVVLCTYTGVVSLTCPSLTWARSSLPGVEVRLLQPGEYVTLTVNA